MRRATQFGSGGRRSATLPTPGNGQVIALGTGHVRFCRLIEQSPSVTARCPSLRRTVSTRMGEADKLFLVGVGGYQGLLTDLRRA